MGSSLLNPLLRDELWIRGDAVENFFGLGAHHARPLYYTNNCKPKESPQNQWISQYCKYGFYVEAVRGELHFKEGDIASGKDC
jgi:hypothetical protein